MEDELLLPPGFRFYPTEEELISFYLHNKLQGKGPPMDHVIPVVDIYHHSPWFLPQYAGVRCRGDREQWFFFSRMQEKAARGGRPNRLTSEGFWKATGCPGYVYSSDNRVIGMKRTMVFYQGRAPNGTKTQWKMNEYIAIEPTSASGESYSSSSPAPPKLRPELSLCRIYLKSKTVRSFDRRPPPPPPPPPPPQGGVGVGVAPPEPRNLRHGNEGEENEKQQAIIHPVLLRRDEKSSSPEYSYSSGDHHDNNNNNNNNNSLDIEDMIIDNEHWWDFV